MFQIGKLSVSSLTSTLGTAAIAANAVANTTTTFLNIPANAVGMAALTVVGQCLGAGEKEQAVYYSRRLMLTAYCGAWVMNLSAFFFANRFAVSLFNLSPEAQAMALDIMVWFNIVSLFVWPSSFTLPNILRAAGDARFTMTVSIVSMWAFRVGFCYLAVLCFGGGLLSIWGEEGFRHFFTVKPVATIDDLKGMKLRVSNDPIMNGMVEGLGASPTVVSFNELYSALQTGVVDGAEQPIANYKSNAFQEVAPNLILDGHTLGAIQVIITDEAWDKLTEEQQNILMEAGKVASQFNRTISEEAENKVLEELKADGINVVEVPDIKPWQDACKGIIESSTKDQAELYQQILDMNK